MASYFFDLIRNWIFASTEKRKVFDYIFVIVEGTADASRVDSGKRRLKVRAACPRLTWDYWHLWSLGRWPSPSWKVPMPV
jgi:hypothetical protein